MNNVPVATLVGFLSEYNVFRMSGHFSQRKMGIFFLMRELKTHIRIDFDLPHKPKSTNKGMPITERWKKSFQLPSPAPHPLLQTASPSSGLSQSEESS